MEWRALPLMLALDSVDPSETSGGSSKEAGPSSSVSGEVGAGLVGVSVEGVVPAVTKAEPGEGGGKAGGNILKPGLFGDGIRAPGDRARLACSFSIRAEFLFAFDPTGEVTLGGSCSSPCVLGSCKERGGRRLTGFSGSCPAASCCGAVPLNLPASSATERRHGASSWRKEATRKVMRLLSLNNVATFLRGQL